MLKQKKVPLRRCTGCMTMKPKKELLRIVHNDGEIFLDSTGKKNGRGAYICNSTECFARAVKNKGLERSLSVPVPKEIYEALKEEIEKLSDITGVAECQK